MLHPLRRSARSSRPRRTSRPSRSPVTGPRTGSRTRRGTMRSPASRTASSCSTASGGSPGTRAEVAPNTAVLFLDIDRFKVLNDSVGHDAGDRSSSSSARACRSRSARATSSRGSAATSSSWSASGSGPSSTRTRWPTACSRSCGPFTIAGSEVVVTASIGIAMVDDRPPEEVLRDADAAMYWAKERGGREPRSSTSSCATASSLGSTSSRAAARGRRRRLRPALPADRVARDNRLAGFEALLRWPHPTRGLLTPDDFLEVAEESGLMRPIGAWVRDEACRQAAAWPPRHPEWGQFVMGVNLSAAELRDPHLAASIERTIARAGSRRGCSRSRSPSGCSSRTPRARACSDAPRPRRAPGPRRLRHRAAPLVHLKELPVHTIKIDHAFVAGLGSDPFDDAIVDVVVDLAAASTCSRGRRGGDAGPRSAACEHRVHARAGLPVRAAAPPGDDRAPRAGSVGRSLAWLTGRARSRRVIGSNFDRSLTARSCVARLAGRGPQHAGVGRGSRRPTSTSGRARGGRRARRGRRSPGARARRRGSCRGCRRAAIRGPPPPSAPCITKFSARTFGAS